MAQTLFNIIEWGAIGYLIGVHIATRKAFRSLIEMHKTPGSIITPNVNRDGSPYVKHVHVVRH